MTQAQHFDHNHKKLLSMIRDWWLKMDELQAEIDALQYRPLNRPEARGER